MNALGHNGYFCSCVNHSAHQNIIHFQRNSLCAFPIAYTSGLDWRHNALLSPNCWRPFWPCMLAPHTCTSLGLNWTYFWTFSPKMSSLFALVSYEMNRPGQTLVMSAYMKSRSGKEELSFVDLQQVGDTWKYRNADFQWNLRKKDRQKRKCRFSSYKIGKVSRFPRSSNNFYVRTSIVLKRQVFKRRRVKCPYSFPKAVWREWECFD